MNKKISISCSVCGKNFIPSKPWSKRCDTCEENRLKKCKKCGSIFTFNVSHDRLCIDCKTNNFEKLFIQRENYNDKQKKILYRYKDILKDDKLPKELLKEMKDEPKDFFNDTDRGRIFMIIAELGETCLNEMLIIFYKRHSQRVMKRNTLLTHVMELKRKKLVISFKKPFGQAIYSINRRSKSAKEQLRKIR